MSPVMLTRVHHVSRLQSTCQRLLSTSRVSPAQFLDSAEEAVADIDPGSKLLGTVHIICQIMLNLAMKTYEKTEKL